MFPGRKEHNTTRLVLMTPHLCSDVFRKFSQTETLRVNNDHLLLQLDAGVWNPRGPSEPPKQNIWKLKLHECEYETSI